MFFSLIKLIITKSDKFSELNDYAILSINSSIYSKYNHLLFANNNYLKSRHNHIDIGNTLLENVTDKCRKLSEKSNNRESNRCMKQVYKKINKILIVLDRTDQGSKIKFSTKDLIHLQKRPTTIKLSKLKGTFTSKKIRLYESSLIMSRNETSYKMNHGGE